MGVAAEIAVSTKSMDRVEWLQQRTKGIGGSDAAVVLGLSKWKTPFELWQEKTGQAPLDETSSEAAYWGTRLEDLVADEFSTRTGKKVRRRNAILQHPEYPWMIANVDRVVAGENAILECKTASAWLRDEWKGEEVPDAYIVQCQHYMAVTGAEKAYVAVLIGGNHFLHKEIPRDDELINIIIQAEKRFWEFHVQGNNPPALDGTSAAERYINERFARAEMGKSITLPPTYQGRVEALLSLKEQIGILERQAKAIENQIKAELEDADTGYVGGYEIRWKQVTTNRLDTKALQEEHPELYGQFAKPSCYRRFEIKEAR